MTNLRKAAILTVLLLAGTWLLMAWAAGMFLPAIAKVDGRDRVLSPFAQQKKFMAVNGKPTLLVWGEQDTNFGPALAKRLASDIPGVVGTIWMKQSAHMPMVEEPAAYAEAVLKFMSDGAPTTGLVVGRKTQP